MQRRPQPSEEVPMAGDAEQLIGWPGENREAKQRLLLVKMLCGHVGTVEVALEESQETRDKSQEEEQRNGLLLPWPLSLLPVQLL